MTGRTINNTEKKLDALIDALGFDVEEVNVNPMRNDRYPSDPIYEYKLTSRTEPYVPLPVQSEAWGCIVDFVLSHREDIINDVNDYGGLGHVLDFMEGNK